MITSGRNTALSELICGFPDIGWDCQFVKYSLCDAGVVLARKCHERKIAQQKISRGIKFKLTILLKIISNTPIKPISKIFWQKQMSISPQKIISDDVNKRMYWLPCGQIL